MRDIKAVRDDLLVSLRAQLQSKVQVIVPRKTQRAIDPRDPAQAADLDVLLRDIANNLAQAIAEDV